MAKMNYRDWEVASTGYRVIGGAIVVGLLVFFVDWVTIKHALAVWGAYAVGSILGGLVHEYGGRNET